MKELGKLTKRPIRDIWKKETEFSAWLAEDENIARLGEEIGIDILTEEIEAGIGDFSADILAKEDGGERLVIIENQYGNTDHAHLGKLITYAAGRGAKVLVWVVEKPRDEHRAAVQWLNENTNADIGVFLVQIKVLSIGNSLPAPQFTVLESPNDWIKSTRQNASLTERKKEQAEWWTSFSDYAMNQPDFRKVFNRRKARPQHWFDLPIGKAGCNIRLSVKENLLGTELYISDDKVLYKNLLERKNDIEKELGFKMDWQELPEKKACRILVTFSGNFSRLTKDEQFFKWYCEKAIVLKKVFPKYLK